MRIEGYELEATIGRGGMGTVYRASRRGSGAGEPVAVKRVPMAGDPDLAAHLRAEADVLAALDHPHIVRVIELLDDGDGVAIAMQLATGGSLADVLAGCGRLPADDVAMLGAKLADALSSAHESGVLHCDVKPHNVLLTGDGEPLLSDFGLARWITRASLLGNGAMGTAEYLDPEVASGAAPDTRSDLYSLGVTCYEALAGQPPFSGAMPLAVLRAADAGGAPPLASLAPEASEAVVAVIERAMARRPGDRFASAAELADAFRESVGAEPAGGPWPSIPGRPPDRPTRVFGPRPPVPQPPHPVAQPRRRRGPSRRVVAAGSSLIVVVGAGVTAAMFAFPDRAHGRAAAPAVVWSGNVADRGGVRFEMGAPGDQLLLGDWDANGTVTPALYRPGAGDVFLFDAWALSGRDVIPSRVLHTGVRGGRAHVVGRAVEVRP